MSAHTPALGRTQACTEAGVQAHVGRHCPWLLEGTWLHGMTWA